jgi:hypothetical protein
MAISYFNSSFRLKNENDPVSEPSNCNQTLFFKLGELGVPGHLKLYVDPFRSFVIFEIHQSVKDALIPVFTEGRRIAKDGETGGGNI